MMHQPSLSSVSIDAESNKTFKNLAMQILSVQKFFVKSKQEDPFLEKYTNIPKTGSVSREDGGKNYSTATTSDIPDGSRHKTCTSFIYLDPFGSWYLVWLFAVSFGVVYNYWTIILRLAFIEGQGYDSIIFIFLDYVIDLLFLLDIWMQSRTGYMENGQLVIDIKKTQHRYMRTLGFWGDCLAVLPFDLLYFAYGINPVFRLGRLLKLHRFVSFYQRVEVITNHYKLFNLAMLIHQVFLIIHWVACGFFLISKSVGFGSEAWVYPKLDGEWAQVSRRVIW